MSANEPNKVGEMLVQMDRRRKDRRRENAGEGSTETTGLQPRTKKLRRRQIDPTTCERDYNNEEIEFMHALDAYKRSSGRMFPTCSEILEVIRGLGYARPNACDPSATTPSEQLISDVGDES